MIRSFHKPGPLHKALTAAALLFFALRAIVPAGLMPAAVTDGWFLQLCPDGLSDSVMRVLMDDAHHHHHHEESKAASSSMDCELGGGVAAMPGCIESTLSSVPSAEPRYLLSLPECAPDASYPGATQPRAPPAELA